MFAPSEAKACKTCARAKRKCGKERPACCRCRDRDIVCEYPPAKPSNYVALDPLPPMSSVPPPAKNVLAQSTEYDGIFLDNLSMDNISNNTTMPYFSGMSHSSDSVIPSTVGPFTWLPEPSDFFDVTNTLHLPSLYNVSPRIPALLWPLGYPSPSSAWFVAPNTWEVDNRMQLHKSSADFDFMRLQISGIRAWVKTWVTTGGCPFIHPLLYGDAPAVQKMPGSVQLAFMSMSSYVNRTYATTGLILDAVDAQAQQLIVQESLFSNPSITEQLARVQALFVYQVIGLFDGNARVRDLADERRATLSGWTHQLHKSAQQAFSGDGGMSLLDNCLDVSTTAVSFVKTPDAELNWHLWILAESIRRIWIVAGAIETIYHAMKHGWSKPAGSLPCTARQGPWQAQSASEWEDCCSKEHPVPCTPTGSDQKPAQILSLSGLGQFLETTDAGDIDVFCRALMSSAYGRERVRQWERNSQDNRVMNSH